MKKTHLFSNLLAIFIALLVTNCTDNQPNKELSLIVDDYIQTYQEREDWEKLLSFYSDSIYLNDINLGMEFNGIDSFKVFYDWPNSNFKKLSPEQEHFFIDDVIVLENKAIIRGNFNPFYWKGEVQEWAGPFIFCLYFNEDNKIIQQYDYVKYPARFLE